MKTTKKRRRSSSCLCGEASTQGVLRPVKGFSGSKRQSEASMMYKRLDEVKRKGKKMLLISAWQKKKVNYEF